MKMTASRKLRTILIWMIAAMLLLPLSSAMAKHHRHGKTQVKVMTRNLYLGADIFKVVEAALNPNPSPDGLDVPRAVAAVFQTVQYTNFNDRAEAIADEVLATRPHVIGIQEASTYYVQSPSDPSPAEGEDNLFIDFYTVLNAALEARGLYYDAYSVINADIELPMLDPTSPSYLTDVRLVDHDIILVRKGLESVERIRGNYQAQLELDVGGTTLAFTRGYLVVDVDIKKEAFRLVNTHLEVRSEPGSVYRIVQDFQMQELLGTVDYIASIFGSKPVVMVGDFNSSPDDVPGFYDPAPGDIDPMPYVPPYMRATEAGYLDTWLLQKRFDKGYTSGFDELVSDPTAELTTRIDHIFVEPGDYTVEKVKAIVVGDEVEDMTPNGLWPSDHAGVVAKIKFSNNHWKRPHR